jgi:hypothetical protein
MLDLPKGVSGFSRHAQCIHCKKLFRSNPRLGVRQKTCGGESCRRKHRSGYQRNYRRENPDVEKEIRIKIRAKRIPDFWKQYREHHPKSAERNRRLTGLRMKLLRSGLQRKLDILQVFDPPGYFDKFSMFATEQRSLLDELKFTPEALNTKGA